MKTVLYREYRPRRFSEVISQEAVVRTLVNQLKNDRVFHAYIFTGVRGTGKTTLARLLAKAVNCENAVDGEPCCECDICRGIDNGSMLDVMEIDAASNTGVDDIRELRDESVFAPSICKKRVFIIDEVHMLSSSAWAALLKIMEEPPEHVMFILATTEIHKVPATILSRCQRFDLKRLTAAELSRGLADIAEKEKIRLAPDAAELIARLADGSMRDALSLLETCLSANGEVTAQYVAEIAGVTDDGYLFSVADALGRGDCRAVLETVNELYGNSVDPVRLCSALTRHYRCLMLAKLSSGILSSEVGADAAGRYAKQAETVSKDRIIEVIRALNEANENMPTSADKRLVAEVALVSLCSERQTTARIAEKPVAEKPVVQKTMPEPVKTAPAEVVSTPEPVAVKPTAERTQSAPKPASKKEEEPSTPINGKRYDDWFKVIARLSAQSPILFAVLDGTSAYFADNMMLIENFDAYRVLVQADPDCEKILRNIIFDITGTKCGIGPYKPNK